MILARLSAFVLLLVVTFSSAVSPSTLRRTAIDPAENTDHGEQTSRLLEKKKSTDEADANDVEDNSRCGTYEGSPCCTGYGDKCMPGMECVKGYCKTCGQEKHDPCCEGHKCNIRNHLTCDFDGFCTDCGGPPDYYCCAVCSDGGNSCANSCAVGEAPDGVEIDANGYYCYEIHKPCCDGQCKPGTFSHKSRNNLEDSTGSKHYYSKDSALVCTVKDVCDFCGGVNEQCCQRPNEPCGHGLVCTTGNMCVPCGGPPTKRCYYDSDRTVPEGVELDANGCYIEYEPCCDDGKCEIGSFPDQDRDGVLSPLVCTVDNKCDFCGGLNRQCCDNPGTFPCKTGTFGDDESYPPNGFPLACSVNNICERCGRENDQCCDGMKCDNSEYEAYIYKKHDEEEHGDDTVPAHNDYKPHPLVCSSEGTCELCGWPGHICCSGDSDGAKCPYGGSCNHYGYCSSQTW